MCGEMEEVLKASGAEMLPYENKNPYPLGSVSYEAGGARMGDGRKASVLDKWNRYHYIKNLLVVDVACFTLTWRNPLGRCLCVAVNIWRRRCTSVTSNIHCAPNVK
jgi:choline dehydrogenase-like flavoprotein